MGQVPEVDLGYKPELIRRKYDSTKRYLPGATTLTFRFTKPFTWPANRTSVNVKGIGPGRVVASGGLISIRVSMADVKAYLERVEKGDAAAQGKGG